MAIYTAIVILHIVGAAIGAGGATMSDFMFFRSVRDGQLDVKEYGFLKMASNLVWFGLILTIITGLGFLYLYSAYPELGKTAGDKVLAKGIIVAIILINGTVMHRKIFPLLKECAEKNVPLTKPPFLRKIPMTLAIGAISITSWYSALILGAWHGLDAPYAVILGVYAVILAGALTVAQLAGRQFVKRFV